MKPFRLALAALLLLVAHTHAASILDYRDKTDDWFTSEQGKAVLANILARQMPTGGWWKNYDPADAVPGEVADEHAGRSIFDNGATTTEMRVLARAYRVTKDEAFRKAFDRGLSLVFLAQYENGGWPQEFPVSTKGYAGQITFNDDAMVRVLQLLKDIAERSPDFTFVDETTRAKAKASFDRGIDCILACQIRQHGELTVWCAQHEPRTLAPAKARAYELPSLSGGESAGILQLLMSIENPSDRVKTSIRAGVAWYERSAIKGIRLQPKVAADDPTKKDYDVVADPTASPLWARFYDLETGKPFYCGRDGVKKDSLDQIERERRTGYAWLRPWGTPVMARYAEWKKTHEPK